MAAEQLRNAVTEVAMPKAGRREREETERVHEGMDAPVDEAQAGGAVILFGDGLVNAAS